MARPPGSTTASARRGRPGRPPGDADKGDARVRERLLDAATELAVEKGLDGAGIREIADRAGVSSGMIAYYFGDRRGLHEAMFERAFSRLEAEFEKAIADQSPVTDLLDNLLRIHATALAANPWLPRLVAREVLGSEGEFQDRFREVVASGPLDVMRKAIANGIERGQLRKDLDPTMCVLTVASSAAFPYLVGPCPR